MLKAKRINISVFLRDNWSHDESVQRILRFAQNDMAS